MFFALSSFDTSRVPQFVLVGPQGGLFLVAKAVTPRRLVNR